MKDTQAAKKITHYALRITHCALAALALVLWCAGGFTAQRAQGSLQSVSARWKSGGVSPAQLEAQLDIFREDRTEDLPNLTLWAQHAAQSVTDGEEKSIQCAVLELYGPAENLRSDIYLSGSAPTRGSTKTCAVSEGAAFALWGGANVKGQTLMWEGQAYAIQGVFMGEDALVILQASPDSKALFPNMQLCFARNGASREAAAEFLARTDFGNPQLLDMPLIGWALEMAAFLPALLIGFWLLARLIIHGVRMRKNPRRLLYFIPPAAAVAATDIFLLSRVSVPAALIPSRWSDFDYWAAQAKNVTQRVETWLSMPQASDINLLFAVLGTALLVFACLLAMTILLGKARVEKPLHALLACGGCMLLLFLLAASYADRGGLQINLAMWLMPCLWILTDCALFRWKGGAVLESENEK